MDMGRGNSYMIADRVREANDQDRMCRYWVAVAGDHGES
jgi:hypothetical protein